MITTYIDTHATLIAERDRLEAEADALGDRFNASTVPAERDSIRTHLGAIMGELNTVAEQRRAVLASPIKQAGVSDPTDANALRAHLVALSRERVEIEHGLSRTRELIAHIAIRVGDPTDDLEGFDVKSWRDLQDARETYLAHEAINAQQARILRDMLALLSE